jgi:cell division protease FtsH
MNSTRPQTQRNSDSAPAGRVQPSDRRSGATQGPGQAKMPPRKTWLWFVLVLLVNYVLMRLLMPSPGAPVTVPYTLFKEEVRKGNVKAIFSRGETIRGRFATPVTYPPAGEQRAAPNGEPQTATTFTTTLPSFVDPGLEAFLIEHKVEISAKPIQAGGSPWVTLLFGFGPALLIIGFYVWMFRRAAQQGGGLGGGLMGHPSQYSNRTIFAWPEFSPLRRGYRFCRPFVACVPS